MIKKLFGGVFLVITLIFSLATIVFGFGSKDNDLREYTHQIASKPGGYLGGHDTIVNEAALLKKDVHGNDADSGDLFKKWVNDALKNFRQERTMRIPRIS